MIVIKALRDMKAIHNTIVWTTIGHHHHGMSINVIIEDNTPSYSNQGYDTKESYNYGRPPQRDTPPYIGVILHQEKCSQQMLAITPFNVTIPPHS